MKLIFKIARTELRNLFYSPIAWFLTIAFLVECAVVYTSNLNSCAMEQEMGGNLEYFTDLTMRVFNNPYNGVFSSVMQNLYLYIPLITMGLISREINNGTISLLYSSPVKVRQIAYGKYLAMMIYSLVLVVVVGIFMVSGVYNIKSADVGLLWSAALGFYLLLCAYSAIGLFMSTLTSYQVVAAIGTFITIGILSYIGRLWQGVDFVRDLTYFLSLQGRTQHMLSGLITTKDVIYFIIIAYIFLGLSIYKLRSGREFKPVLIKIARYMAIVLLALVVGYISSRPGLIGYWDTSARKTNTLTINAQNIIKALGDSPLEITLYDNALENYYFMGIPEERNRYLGVWEPYVRFKPDINFHYIYYYDTAYDDPRNNMFQYYPGKTMEQIAKQRIEASGEKFSLFKTPAEIHKIINLRPELNRLVMQLKYRERTTFLRFFDDAIVWPTETEVSAAFNRLLQARMPKIFFVTGNSERDVNKNGDREYQTLTNVKTFRWALINQGFNVDTISLDTADIPDSITALVIADPRSSLSPGAISKINQYINKGGNLMIMGEPGRQSLLNPLLKPLGVQLLNGMLEQQSEDYAANLVLSQLTEVATRFSKSLNADTLPVSMSGVAALSCKDTNGFSIEPLLVTRAGVVRNTMARNPDLDMVAGSDITAGEVSEDAVEYSVGGTSKRHRIDTSKNAKWKSRIIPGSDSDRAYTVAAALTRQVNGRQQRIIVTGDADLMSNAELGRQNIRTSNFMFNTALFSWVDYGQFPIDTSRPPGKDNRVTVTKDQVSFLNIIYVWVLPGLLLIFGSVLLIRRKRK